MQVSVVVAAYNCASTIGRALGSVLNQTTPVMEVIVVDDASTDETVAVVKAMAAEDPRIVLVEGGQNRGPSYARNLGIKAAKGDWIGVLDADDAWSLDRVRVFGQTIDRFDVDVVADNQFLYDATAQKVTRLGFSPEHGVRWIKPADVFEQDVQLGAEFSYGILKPFIRRSFLEAHAIGYSNSIRYGEDLLFLAELLIAGAKAVLIPVPLYIYSTRVGEESKVASPHSRSIPRFDLFAVGIDALKSEYEASITRDVALAMRRLAGRFRQVHQANLAREERHKRGMLAYALYLARRPAALAQVIRQRAAYVKRRLSAKLAAAWSRLGELPSGRMSATRGGAMARIQAGAVQLLVSLAFAVPLVALTTLVRSLLASQLMSQSPFTIYVASVVAGTLLMGPLCGALTMAGGAAAGIYFFVEPSGWAANPAGLTAMVIFCFVSICAALPTAALRRKIIAQKPTDLDGGFPPMSRPVGSPWAQAYPPASAEPRAVVLRVDLARAQADEVRGRAGALQL